MNNKEVYINGVLCDLDEVNNPIQLVYAINDLGELKDRQAYSTNTFKLPPTQKNLTACGLPNNSNLIQTQPYRKNTAKIIQNGIEVLPNGIAIINGTSKEIEVQILSGLIGFFDKLGDKKITDLDLSEYDHIWNIENVMNSQDNVEGYVYPVIDYGTMSATERTVDARNLRPATFRKTIIEKIISEAGYTASGSYTSYDKYIRSIIPFTNDTFQHGPAYAEYLAGFNMSARKTVVQSVPRGPTDGLINFEDSATTDSSGSWHGDYYIAGATFKARVSMKYSITQMFNALFGTPGDVEIFVQKSTVGGGPWTDVGYSVTRNSSSLTQETFIDQPIDFEINMNPGDQLKVVYKKAVNRVMFSMLAGSSFTVTPVAEDVIFGSGVQLSATLPDISQKNFFKDFLQNFGLIVIPDNYKKELLLINMEDVYANKPIADDISDRLINSPDDISYSMSGYGINNHGKYKGDDAVPDELGEGVMVFDNLTLNDNVTLFTSVFAASQSVFKLGGLSVVQINKGADFKTKTQPRILLNRIINSNFYFVDGLVALPVLSVSLPTFDGLDYQTLFDENYPEIKRMLYRPFVVVKDILLRETDIANIDWTIPVYDRKSASYYYKNQITYMQGDVSTISLIKLP